jgi:hypothetical protein
MFTITKDSLTPWIAQRCELDADAWERTSNLFPDWVAWAVRSNVWKGDI